MASVETNARGSVLVFGDGVPLGYELAETLSRTPAPDVRLSNTAYARARELRAAIGSCVNSKSPDDQSRVGSINQVFQHETLGLPPQDSPVPWTSDIMRRLYKSPSWQLTAFALWNTTRNEEHQKALNEHVPQLIDASLLRLKKLANLSMYQDSTIEYCRQVIESSSDIEAVDAFEVGGLHAYGYLDAGADRLALSNMFSSPESFEGSTPNQENVYLHEVLHRVILRMHAPHQGQTGPSHAGSLLSQRLLDEPLTHFPVVVSEDDNPIPEVMMPSERQVKKAISYKAELELLGWAIAYGSHPVAVDHLMAAKMGTGAEKVLATMVEQRLNASMYTAFPAYGEAAYLAMADEYEQASHPRRAELLTTWLRRIHGKTWSLDDEELQPASRNVSCLYSDVIELDVEYDEW